MIEPITLAERLFFSQVNDDNIAAGAAIVRVHEIRVPLLELLKSRSWTKSCLSTTTNSNHRFKQFKNKIIEVALRSSTISAIGLTCISNKYDHGIERRDTVMMQDMFRPQLRLFVSPKYGRKKHRQVALEEAWMSTLSNRLKNVPVFRFVQNSWNTNRLPSPQVHHVKSTFLRLSDNAQFFHGKMPVK